MRLSRELRKTDIRVSLVKSGIATTELFKIASFRSYSPARGMYGPGVKPEILANRVWALIVKPQRIIYVPHFMAVVSWMEQYAGRLVDFLRERILPARLKPAR